MTDLFYFLRSETSFENFKCFLSTLLLRFVSKPIVRLKMQIQLSLIFKSRPGRKSSPVMIENLSTTFNAVARKFRTELCWQGNLGQSCAGKEI